MSVVVERDLRRLPRRQAEVPESAGARSVRSPGPRAPSGHVAAADAAIRSRERLLGDGRRYRRGGVAGCSARAPVHRWPAMVALALVLVAGIAVLALLARGMAGMVSQTAPVPDETALVVVERGQSLWELARHHAPESATIAVVDRIQRLNELTGQGVRAGTPLVVPIAPEAAPAGD